MRIDGRKADEMRPFTITRNFQKFSSGSVLVEFGDTKVICSASIENKVPLFLRGKRQGWLTAEYSLLPGSTAERTQRDSSRGKVSGRSHEIQRLIGRSMRAIVDMAALGERTIWLDCDVLQADGGTRTASVTGAWFALADALMTLDKTNNGFPIKDYCAAISIGIVQDQVLLDLNYAEDSQASVDLNLVLTGSEKIVEIQGTSEMAPFEFSRLNEILEMGKKGIAQLISIQKDYMGEYFKNRFQTTILQ